MRQWERTLRECAARRDSGQIDDGEEREMLRLCHLQYLIWLDMLRPPPQPKDERWNLLGLVMCLPLYGYGLYKLFVG